MLCKRIFHLLANMTEYHDYLGTEKEINLKDDLSNLMLILPFLFLEAVQRLA